MTAETTPTWEELQRDLATYRPKADQLATAEGKVAEYAEAVGEWAQERAANYPAFNGREQQLWDAEERLADLAATPPTGASLKELREEVERLRAALERAEGYINDHYRFTDGSVRPVNAGIEVLEAIRAALAGTTQEGEDRDEEFARLGREQYGTGFESDEPKDYCETCGGRGWVGQYVGPGDISEKVGCPDCQPEGE